jgi:hypothetical protein
MDEKKVPQEQEPAPTLGKKPWQEPKLAFVEPKLTKHGSLEEITGDSFFGGFTPQAVKKSS